MLQRLVPVLLLALLPLPSSAAEAGKAPGSVADLGWISGDWHGTMGGGTLHEQWSAPAGGAMMGMFRWIREGKVSLYEFLVIEDSPKGPVLTFRHFNPGLIGWEEKDAPLRCPLAAGKPGEAAFACEGTGTRLTFRRAGPDALTVLLERQQDGKPKTDEFAYKRAK